MNIALSICIKRNMEKNKKREIISTCIILVVIIVAALFISGEACSSRAENGNHDRFRRNRQAQSANRDIILLFKIIYIKK